MDCISPLSFPHISKEAVTLAGCTIPANTATIVSIHNVGRDRKVWKDPLQFNPEKFMGVDQDKFNSNSMANLYLLPFSSGRRACPGFNLAWPQLLTATASLVHAFDWTVPEGKSNEDIKVDDPKQLEYDLYLVPTPRPSCRAYKV
jgi:cytochrome P450